MGVPNANLCTNFDVKSGLSLTICGHSYCMVHFSLLVS